MNRLVAVLSLIAMVFFVGDLQAQETSIRKLKYNGGELELLVNSETLSQVVAINNHGSILGTREISDNKAGVLRSIPFYVGKHGTKDIPTPATFSNLEPIAISDSELVIAYATRPPGSKEGSLGGVVWNAKDDSFVVLPKPPGDLVNQPQAISADGKRIAGYSTGPDRLRPVLWQCQDDSKSWTVTVLSTEFENNPYLMSGALMISPDGKWIAGSCTEAFMPDGTVDSALYRWTESKPGTWDRKKLSKEQLYLRGINDQGEMAGSIRGKTGERQPCYVSPQGEFQILKLLPGDVSGEAKGINSSSMIIGFSDDPPGGDGGPEPCFWSKDKAVHRLAPSDSPSDSWYGIIQGINQEGQMAGFIEDPQTGASLAFRTLK